MYHFKVSNVEDIDIQRICDENPGADALLVTGKNAMLLLRRSFLEGFNYQDMQEVAGELLYPGWGHGLAAVAQVEGGAHFHTGTHSLYGWRARFISLSDASGAVQGLIKAREYKRSINVKVHVI